MAKGANLCLYEELRSCFCHLLILFVISLLSSNFVSCTVFAVCEILNYHSGLSLPVFIYLFFVLYFNFIPLYCLLIHLFIVLLSLFLRSNAKLIEIHQFCLVIQFFIPFYYLVIHLFIALLALFLRSKAKLIERY